ncbi:histidine kinase [Ferruginibacter sp.]
MKKTFILLIILCTALQYSFAQNKYVDSLINWVNNTKKIDSIYIVNLHRISYRLSETDIKTSYEYYKKTAYYSDSINFTYGKALAQINLGILFSNSANFDASNDAYFKAIGYADKCGALRLEAISLNNLGENFRSLQDFAKSRQYSKQAININTQLKAWRGVAINYELQQQCDLEEKLYNDAWNNLKLGMPFADSANDSYVLAQFYTGFGKLYAVNDHTDSAQFYFTKALAEAAKEGDLRNEYYVYLAKVQYLKNIKPAEKLALLKKALDIARQTSYLEGVSDAARQVSVAYDESNNKDSSLAYYRVYRSTADSVFSQNTRRNVTIKETEWLITKKEIENRQLQESALLQNKQLVLKNNWLLAVIIFLVLAIAIVIAIYKSIQNRKNKTEAALKQKIAETEMAALKAQMNPHFMFNCINSIDAFIQSNDKYNATVYLNKFARLIRNVLDSSKQNLVSFSKDIETLKLYIELEELRSDNKFITKVKIDDELMNSDCKVPPLIVQPFVENAILHGLRNKHGNNGLLSIDVAKTDNNIVYTITDNGIGRQAAEKLNSKKEKSYGMDMSYERIRLFNKETDPSVKIVDLYDADKPAGTNIIVQLNIL